MTTEDRDMDFRGFRKILRMVGELHLRGYQRLRIAPGMAPTGGAWRCAITCVTNISGSHGALMVDENRLAAHYTTGAGREYFGWKDVKHATPSHLADLFLKRLPTIAHAGLGSDWVYAGWYVEMLHLTYPNLFPIAYADWDLPSDHLPTTGGGTGVKIPLPPAGWGPARF